MSDSCRVKAPGQACGSCPWRTDKDARDIPNFDLHLAEELANTCPDENGMGPSFGASWFACHQSREGEEIPCAGWLATVGRTHPGVRIAISSGKLDASVLDSPECGPTLHETYGEVLAKLRATCPS